MVNQSLDQRKKTYLQVGIYILVLLAVLTITEFAVSIAGVVSTSIFLVIALVKAFLVARDYMHVERLFTEEEHQ